MHKHDINIIKLKYMLIISAFYSTAVEKIDFSKRMPIKASTSFKSAKII